MKISECLLIDIANRARNLRDCPIWAGTDLADLELRVQAVTDDVMKLIEMVRVNNAEV